MASLYIHVAFIISIAITISQALATTNDKINELSNSNVTQPQIMLKNLTELTMHQISTVSPDFTDNGPIRRLIDTTTPNNKLALSALSSCQELLSLAINNLNKSLSTDVTTVEGRASVMSGLCAAGTTLQTCVDGFEDQPRLILESVYQKLKDPIDLNKDSTKFMAMLDSESNNLFKQDSEYPHWLSESDRNLLGDSKIMSADVVVAKDGSGKYKIISDAVKAAPRLSKKRFVIYVKSGIYKENVKVEADRWNVMIYGDGMDKTIIYSNLSHGGGVSTWDSATFAVQGEGFIARDIRFTNTAGAINGQAVALLSTADRSVFYRCRIDGYQDSLFVHSNRQFYRECDIYGTVDFIFGGAAVVIQKGTIFARKPLRGQDNTITAQFKTDPKCTTGIVVQSTMIRGSGNLTGVSTFLGRPWTPYATTVFMQNIMNKLINPKGWRLWNTAPWAPPTPDTVFLAEYRNRGYGAQTKDRVKWKGVRVNLSYKEASRYTVGSFIQGNQWLPATQVSYDSGL